MSLHDALLAKAFGGGNGGNGGGANIDVVASVGQTIVVEEVDADGKPTKWKAAEYQERTHWSEETVGDLVPHTVFKPILNPTLQMLVYMLPEFGLAVGKTYTVIYDGVEYPCTAVSGTLQGLDFVSIGNAYLATGTQTSEPFIVAKIPDLGATLVVNLADGDIHTIQILGEKMVYHKPAPEYAPNEYRVAILRSGVVDDNGSIILHFNADWDELVAAIRANKNVYADIVFGELDGMYERYTYTLVCARLYENYNDIVHYLQFTTGTHNTNAVPFGKGIVVTLKTDGTVNLIMSHETP